MSQPKTNCADCGTEMNRHAFEIDYGVDDPKFVEAIFGGAIKETCTCPECGRTELRTA